MKEINLYDAVKILRKLAAENIPCKIGFISCDTKRKTSKGYIEITHAIIGQGLRKDQSIYANDLIAFTDMDTGEHKHFWLPLLMKLNDLKITYDRIYRPK